MTTTPDPDGSAAPPIALGLDLGGSKIEIIALDTDGRERLRERVATPRNDYQAGIRAIRELVSGAEARLGVSGATVGIGHPGSLDPVTGRIKNANATWMIGQAFDVDLRQALARPVALANDANCLALSEATDGAARGADVVFGVILGTGVGGGLVIDGKVIQGANAIAGEWGHNPLPWPRAGELPGPQSYCGLQGCIEEWLSGPGLAADHLRVTGEESTGPEIVVAAELGEPKAQATLARYEDRLARALATVINLIDPEVIVLGGGLGHIRQLYDTVPKLWRNYVFVANNQARDSISISTQLVAPVHGDSSGVRGAAWLGQRLAQRSQPPVGA